MTEDDKDLEEGVDIFSQAGEEIQKRSVRDTKSYILSLKGIIKRIEKSSPEDRVDYAKALNLCLNGALLSLGGWKSWVGDIDNIAELRLEELKTLYPKIKDLVIQFLKLDIEITQKKLLEAVVKVKSKRTKGKRKGDKSAYVT